MAKVLEMDEMKKKIGRKRKKPETIDDLLDVTAQKELCKLLKELTEEFHEQVVILGKKYGVQLEEAVNFKVVT